MSALTSISIPAGTKDYTHAQLDGSPCRSFWAQHVCSCGAYALTWETQSIDWVRPPTPRPIDRMPVPGDPSRTTSPHWLDSLPWVSGNAEIMAVVHEAVEGDYEVIHQLLPAGLAIRPKGASPITVHASPRLILRRDAKRRVVKPGGVLRCHIRLDGREWLEEVDPSQVPQAPVMSVDTLNAAHQQRIIGTVPLPQSLAQPHPRPKAPPPSLVVAPSPPPPVVTGPPPVDAPVPEILAAICQKVDLQPDRRDYLVIPQDSVPADTPLPAWVVRSPHVDRIHVHKPEAGLHYPFGGEAEEGSS